MTAYDQLLWELAAKLDKRQGTEHVGKVLAVGDDGIASPQYPAVKEWTKLPTFYKEVMTSGDFFVDVVKLDISKDLSDIPLGLYYDSGVNDSHGEKPYYYGTGVRIVDGEAKLRQLVGTGPLVNINMITDEKIKITFFGADLNPQVIYTFDRTNRTLDASWIDSLSRLKTVELLKEKVDIEQGSENAGRVLVVGDDGVVTTKELSQADWEQSDSTAPDYIKNRPCYSESHKDDEDQKPIMLDPRSLDNGYYPIMDCTTAGAGWYYAYYRYNPVRVAGLAFRIVVGSAFEGYEDNPLETLIDPVLFECIDTENYKFHHNLISADIYVIVKPSLLSEANKNNFPSPGIYLERTEKIRAKTALVYAYLVTEHQLKERYIPATIARTADIENLPKTNAEEIAMLIETDTLPAVKNADGKLLSTGGNKIIMRH